MENGLYIISTPIGNLGDITKRAVDTLKNLDILLVEDTRVSGKLLKNFDIDAKMISFNEYSEKTKTHAVAAAPTTYRGADRNASALTGATRAILPAVIRSSVYRKWLYARIEKKK